MALFTTFGMQKNDNIIFCMKVLKNKVTFKKVVSKVWCKESKVKIGITSLPRDL